MEKIKDVYKKINSWKFIIVFILVIGGIFYWYEIRPSIIYSNCHYEAMKYKRNGLIQAKNNYEFGYERCLKRHGFR